jgi:RNA polymerase sigma-70 factor (ECF subfamily)
MVAETRGFGMEAFEAEALPHFDDLYRTAVRVIGDRAEAEDLVQEAYLQAWKSFHRFELGTNCRAWLFKILFHVIHHHRRKWFNFKWVEDGEEHLKESLAYEPPIPEQITDEDLLAALNQVPEAFREVILLVDVQEFSYKEISEILKIPIGTVMSRLSRGRQALRTHLTSSPTHIGFQRAEVAHKSAQLG